MLVLGIETSCDETAVGIVEDRLHLRSDVVASQVALHARFGGVVPEVAARAHLDAILPTIDRALTDAGVRLPDLDAIAVTRGPGLAGALLVGVAAAKGLALATDLPLIGVNHLRAHLEVAQLEHGDLDVSDGPVVALVVSGGHTSIIALAPDGTMRELGATLDDAAGEAFDKIARYLGLGFPGGPAIDRAARTGRADAHDFPRPTLDEPGYDLSLSGLKSAVVRELDRLDAAGTPVHLPDVAASFQEAIVDVQVTKTMRAASPPSRACARASMRPAAQPACASSCPRRACARITERWSLRPDRTCWRQAASMTSRWRSTPDSRWVRRDRCADGSTLAQATP